MLESAQQQLTLEDLRKIDPANEQDLIKKRLAELFSVEELDKSDPRCPEYIAKQQDSIYEKIWQIEDGFNQSLDSITSNADLTDNFQDRAKQLLEDALGEVTQIISESECILANTRASLIHLVENILLKVGKYISVESIRIDQIRDLLESKKWQYFMIRSPHLMRKKLYKIYTDLPNDQKKIFFKQAIRLMKELTVSQVDAFFQAYEQLWSEFQSAGLNLINMTGVEIRQLFFDNGYEISSEGQIDFVEALLRSRNQHNKIITTLQSQELRHLDQAQAGKAFFQAFLRNKVLSDYDFSNFFKENDLNLDQFPYGKVELDFTLPVTSIRMICHDQRDFGFLTGRLQLQGYANGEQQTYKISGLSKTEEQLFRFSDQQQSLAFPLIIIKGGLEITPGIITHEDAHQAIIVGNSSGRQIRQSAESRSKKPEFEELVFDEVHENFQYEILTQWRRRLQHDFNQAELRMRNELQAFLSDGLKSLSRLRSDLLKVESLAEYDYIGNFRFRKENIKNIIQFLPQDQQDFFVEVFKKDVLKAKSEYEMIVRRVAERVKILIARFLKDDDVVSAKLKVGVLMRHVSLGEFLIISRYLVSKESYSDASFQEKLRSFEKIEKPAFSDLISRSKDEHIRQLILKAPDQVIIFIKFIKQLCIKAPRFDIGSIQDKLAQLEKIDTAISPSVGDFRVCLDLYKFVARYTLGSVITWSDVEDQAVVDFSQHMSDISKMEDYQVNTKSIAFFLRDLLFDIINDN